MNNPTLNIYLDIDDVIFKWNKCFTRRYNVNIFKSWVKSDLMDRRITAIEKEKDFWLNLEIKNIPDFTPKGYVSARSIPKIWTYESLKNHNIPGRSNIHHVKRGESKIQMLRQLNCDIFVDDKVETYIECAKNGIFCLLMDAEHNQEADTEFRIYDLNYQTIISKYYECLLE